MFPCSATALPLPPVPAPKQVAFGLVLTEMLEVFDQAFGEHLVALADDAQRRR